MKNYKNRIYPENAKIQNIDKYGIATYASEQGSIIYYGLKIYKGNSKKPYVWHHYESEKQRNSTLEYYLKQAREFAEIKEKNKTEAHPFKVGDIVYNSWGYEQTNIDFYQVVKTTEKTITIQKIAQETTETGFMSGDTTPLKDNFIDDELIVKKPRLGLGNDWWINFEYGAGKKINDNESMHCSWYA